METNSSIFVRMLGETPIVKALDFFLTFDSFDCSKSRVSGETGVSRIIVNPEKNHDMFLGSLYTVKLCLTCTGEISFHLVCDQVV